MKRLTALIVALLIGVTMFAQQALWGSAPVVSPEIHGNNTVTFRFKAPKAVRVQLTGDFLPVQKNAKFEAPGIVDLKEGQEGVWEYTTPEPLKPELYSYSFIVDGLRVNDPANVYLAANAIPCFISFTEWVAMKKHGFLWAVLHRYWTT